MWRAAGVPGAARPAERGARGAVRVTVTVWDWPAWSVQLRLILSPGWWLASADWMSEEDVTVWPATEVIWSPAVRPAWAAADPGTTPAMATPLPLAEPPPKLPPAALPPLEVAFVPPML